MSSTKPALRERLRYAFDNTLSRGPSALIIWLGIGTLLLIALGTGAVLILHGIPDGANLFAVFWNIMSQALTPNPVDAGNPLQYLAVMFFVTIGSLFMVSAFIGILNNTIEGQLEDLRKGRSRVLENDHTLILGWTPQIFTIISELVLANESRKSGAIIVVMADHDKVEMEDAIHERIPDMKNTRVICRSGSPIDLTDLEISSPHTSRSIIVLAEGADPDTHVIKTVLAITNNPKRRAEAYHIVTQIRDPKNMDVVKMIGAKDLVQPILTNDLIARVVAQTSRQSGLSIVYTELMDFGGDEIYFKQEPSLSGKTYGEALLAYETSTLMGIRQADGTIALSPSMNTRIQPGDQVFVLAADEDKIDLAELTRVTLDESLIRVKGKVSRPTPERALILGWNHSGATIIRELDNYVPKGSQVTVVSDILDLEKKIRLDNGKLKNQKITVKMGDIRDRALLEKLGASNYDHVIVLAYNHLEQQEADAITLITLLHLRDIAERDETPFSIVSEMLDLRNRELAEAARVDDFIVSEHLVSLMMTQLSENAELLDVFTDIFDPEGAEIYLKPIGNYIATNQPVNFYTVTEAARRRGETALGYRLMSEGHDSDKAYGVHTNPRKSEKVVFSPEDKIIVVAES
jgi:voltage-gated potassium channel Kch